jgi:hypothetical protein
VPFRRRTDAVMERLAARNARSNRRLYPASHESADRPHPAAEPPRRRPLHGELECNSPRPKPPFPGWTCARSAPNACISSSSFSLRAVEGPETCQSCAGLGLPRTVFDELARIQSHDVDRLGIVFPTRMRFAEIRAACPSPPATDFQRPKPNVVPAFRLSP